jgi:transcriptional regulator with XRE-family HTH domain
VGEEGAVSGEPVEIQVARWVRGTREKIGLTLDDVSTLSGVSCGVVSAIESGVGTTRIANVAAVIQSLGGTLEVLDGSFD